MQRVASGRACDEKPRPGLTTTTLSAVNLQAAGGPRRGWGRGGPDDVEFTGTLKQDRNASRISA